MLISFILLLVFVSMPTIKADAKNGRLRKNAVKHMGIRNSKDDADYGQNGKAVIKLAGISRIQTLYVTQEALEESDDRNRPVRVGLSVGKSKITFESLWNDGIRVGVADFDKSDQYIDIYLTELGTDIVAATHIYRFNGSVLCQYGTFEHLFKDFCYDGQGRIFYSKDESSQTPDTIFDYRSKKSGRIRDRRLQLKLKMFKISSLCRYRDSRGV